MTERITLELPDKITLNARLVATRTERSIEEVLVDWLDRSTQELPMEMLPDEQVLALADSQMNADQQAALGQLLARNREGKLNSHDQSQLEILMQSYRRGLVRKAQALKVAVDRGLIPPLS